MLKKEEKRFCRGRERRSFDAEERPLRYYK